MKTPPSRNKGMKVLRQRTDAFVSPDHTAG